jgi:hypothetical protein
VTSYNDVTALATSPGLLARLTGCAAMEAVPRPQMWVNDHIYELVSRSDWLEAWEYAENQKTANVNQDTGARVDVINDGMILASVQAVREAQAGSPA